jgi:hypothetical protein
VPSVEHQEYARLVSEVVLLLLTNPAVRLSDLALVELPEYVR